MAERLLRAGRRPACIRIRVDPMPAQVHSTPAASRRAVITALRRRARRAAITTATSPDRADITTPTAPATPVSKVLFSNVTGYAAGFLLAALLLAQSASAQTSDSLAADSRVRTLLSWIDDAEVIEPGGAEVTLGFARWTTQFGHETDAPTIFAAVGVAPRVQLAASGLLYSSSYADGFASSGRGDGYLISKIAVVSPREHPGGIALSPMIEILSDLSLAYREPGASRVQWGIPITFQYTTVKLQFIGSTGYFSRGSIFAGGGVEAFVAPNVITSVTALYSHATTSFSADDAYGLKRRRVDVTGGVDLLVSPVVTLFGTIGRTVSGTDSSSTDVIGTVGISLRLYRF
jgi:hypothetical protein